MRESKIRILLLAALCFCSGFLTAQTESDTSDYYHQNYFRYENYIYNNNIKTVVLERSDAPLTDPVIEKNTTDRLILTFDDLGSDLKNYSYTFIHCNSDWTPSNIITSQYLPGFFDDRILDYDYSFNTKQTYTHYSLVFPNQNLNPVLSGNYILKVFETDYPDSVIITRRWMIFEDKVQIDARVKRATIIADRYTKQEIDFSIFHPLLEIQNPFNDIKVVLTQNGRWDNAITNLKPLYLKDKLLDYNYDEENVFNGGNEFRTFDIRPLKFQTQYIKGIIEDSTGYHVYVADELSRAFLVYAIWDDINGKFLNVIYEDRESDTEADYATVHFKLKMPDPVYKGTPYIFGGLTDWRILKEAKLKYNYDNLSYETSLYLKQGYYNYEYVVLNDGTSDIDETLIEGNHFETENDYAIFVYHRPIGGRYDQLVGWKKLNSKKIY
ncbi:MAG: DUF5103 domain-containing protein [Bacteroidia bacterium]